jgi:hypothetical protein
MPLTYIDRSEREDFEAMLRLRNLLASDFELADNPTRIAAPARCYRPPPSTQLSLDRGAMAWSEPTQVVVLEADP